jgi:hypothetical protein
LRNVFKKQVGLREQHAFHILGLSKLPIFVGTLAGIMALTFISKLQYSYDFSNISVLGIVLSDFYLNPLGKALETETDTKLVVLLLLLIIVIIS